MSASEELDTARDTPRPDETGLTTGTLLNGHRVIERLGRGGQGDVYSVETDTGEHQAVKVLTAGLSGDAEIVRRLEREAATASAIVHDHVTRIFGLERTTDGHVFIRMELLRGTPLNVLLKKEGALQIPLACDLIQQAAEGLGAAHARGVIHRDVKPQNIFVVDTPSGPSVKLLDFGIAKAAARWDLTALTLTGNLVGTPAYMSPEQIMLPDELDHRTDVYSLGLVFYEMLTGHRTFKGKDVAQVLMLHAKANPTDPRRFNKLLSAPIADVVMRCLAKRPESRFSSMRAFIEALERAQNAPDRPPSFSSIPAVEPRPVSLPHFEPPKRGPWATIILTVTLLCLGGAFLVSAMSTEPAPVNQPAPPTATFEPSEPPAPPQLAVPAAPSSVQVASRPSGALIFMGQTLIGQTPKRLELAPEATHTLRLRLDGYRDGALTVRLSPGEEANRTVVLERAKKEPIVVARAQPVGPNPQRLYAKLDQRLAFELDRKGLNRADLPWIVQDVGADWLTWRRGVDGGAERVQFAYDLLVGEVRALEVDKPLLREKLRRVLEEMRASGAARFEDRYFGLRERSEAARSRTELEALLRQINRLELEIRRKGSTR